ncbi:fimbrial protein [uncultured Parabacteroides sp.]|uniref:fimbrial protein n=1 Tax=uncultured Parabacteroides sp. TaxID=512312 RepID=UPI00265A1504|nr:fimbrial protein [uncultured Parabacteroides sp.]
MKLRNLFLASLAVCTMASCSKDDDGISGPQEVDAYLSFASTTDVMTKTSIDGGTDAGIGKEAKIQSLTAYVFDESGKYVISKHVALTGSGTENEDFSTEGTDGNKSINSIRGIHVKVGKPTSGTTSETQFQVVLLANMESLSVTSLEDLRGKATPSINEFNKAAVGKSYLPMHAELTVSKLTPSTDSEHIFNWYKTDSSWDITQKMAVDNISHSGEIPAGAGRVILTRSIARVQFTSLSAKFTALQYQNLSFVIDSIYLANVRETATVVGTEKTDAAYFRGGPDKFEVIQDLIDPADGKTDSNLLQEYKSVTLSDEVVLDNTELGFDKYINVNSPESISGGYQTRLVITGTLSDGTKPLGRKYFHIPLKLKDNVGNVMSNKFFKVIATITGEGSPNPDEILENACINFSIEVAPWEVIEQTEDDTN